LALEGDDIHLLVQVMQTQLRRLAHRERRRLNGSDTLQTTALVNEAYLKLFQQGRWQSRAHFLNLAAMAMRQVLVGYAREQWAQKRGGDVAQISLDEAHDLLAQSDECLIALDQALVNLEAQEPRLARVVECRYFAGYSQRQTADALNITERTVQRDWNRAKTIIYAALGAD
jgi:RNA polymerase sigma factor (TIGR02999 family)